eukprot:TRINITY_DN8878_c0_g1_i2.p1 TRINITY_DN8878_c0_g1~~TRINITY_DN8878_c0_g1_i2.p1  ORF type:complete len:410 (-),score=56.16 TRINITY_DN8878_c0_g1_i2:118-1347(-)
MFFGLIRTLFFVMSSISGIAVCYSISICIWMIPFYFLKNRKDAKFSKVMNMFLVGGFTCIISSIIKTIVIGILLLVTGLILRELLIITDYDYTTFNFLLYLNTTFGNCCLAGIPIDIILWYIVIKYMFRNFHLMDEENLTNSPTPIRFDDDSSTSTPSTPSSTPGKILVNRYSGCIYGISFGCGYVSIVILLISTIFFSIALAYDISYDALSFQDSVDYFFLFFVDSLSYTAIVILATSCLGVLLAYHYFNKKENSLNINNSSVNDIPMSLETKSDDYYDIVPTEYYSEDNSPPKKSLVCKITSNWKYTMLIPYVLLCLYIIIGQTILLFFLINRGELTYDFFTIYLFQGYYELILTYSSNSFISQFVCLIYTLFIILITYLSLFIIRFKLKNQSLYEEDSSDTDDQLL